MMRNTVLGVTIAPAAQQWRVAKIMIGVVLAITVGASGAFVGPFVYRHYTYVDAEAMVTAKEIKCHYQINRLNKRGAAQVTDLVDCAEARRVAARVDHAMGEIRQVAVVRVTYRLADGAPMGSWFDLPADAAADISAGRSLTIQYHPDLPHRIQRRADDPFALVARNRYAGAAAIARAAPAAPRATGPERPKFQLAKDGEPMSGIEIFSRGLAWIIVAAMAIGILWVLRWLWRLARRLKLPNVEAGLAASTADVRAAVGPTRVAVAMRSTRPPHSLQAATSGKPPVQRR